MREAWSLEELPLEVQSGRTDLGASFAGDPLELCFIAFSHFFGV